MTINATPQTPPANTRPANGNNTGNRPQPVPAPAPFKLNITRGVAADPPRIVIHGTPGIGKSTLASKAPNPIFLDLEHGTLQLDVARVNDIETWEQLLAAIRALTTEPHDFKTLVLDTLDRAEWLCWQHVCAKAKVSGIEAVGKYGRGYLAAYEEFRGLARALDALRAKRHMAVIVVAHSKVENAPNAAGDEHQRWTLKVHKLVAGLFYESFDVILFARLEIFTSKSEGGKVKGHGDARVLETQEAGAWLAKNRYGLPRQMNLDWNELAAGLARGAGEVVEALREDIGAALDRLHALDESAAVKARETYEKATDDAAALSILLNRINAGVAQREAARAAESATDNGNTAT